LELYYYIKKNQETSSSFYQNTKVASYHQMLL
jgi:hypothetical protein